MDPNSDEIKKLEDFLDNLPNAPSEKSEDKMLWSLWARLYPKEAMTKSKIGLKIATIKLLAKPDIDIDKFEEVVNAMKKNLANRSRGTPSHIAAATMASTTPAPANIAAAAITRLTETTTRQTSAATP